MPDNHLLLYRLAELMFKHEQHVLPVDLLFDDEQIGDFVKSIQIDSPYQQLLLEGVLTETIRDEKIYVSFTVEGYFHFVLGEVIYNRLEGLGVETLKQIVEENKLNGAKEGVEQFFVIQLQNGEYEYLFKFISDGTNFENICIKPLAVGLSNLYHALFIDKKNISIHIINLLSNILNSDFEHHFIILNMVISYLEKMQKIDIVRFVMVEVIKNCDPKNLHEAILLVRGVEYQEIHLREELLSKINLSKLPQDHPMISFFYESYGKQYSLIGNYEKALLYFKEALEIYLKYFGEGPNLSSHYNNLGLTYFDVKDYISAVYFFEKALIINLAKLDEAKTTISYNNLGLAYHGDKNYDKAEEFYLKSLDLDVRLHGSQHLSTSTTLSNLGQIYRTKEDCITALNYLNKALSINLKIVGENNRVTGIVLNNIGNVYKQMSKNNDALLFYNRAFKIFTNQLGINHPYSKLVNEKIFNLNDL